jgi:hypothetical protein
MDQLIPSLQNLLDATDIVAVMWGPELDESGRKRVFERLGMSEAH